MQKRSLAILAMVATVLAFGVGSALAEGSPWGPDDPNPGCRNGNPPGCEDGRPGPGEDEDDGEGGETPGPEALCEALGGVVAELEQPCLDLLAALTGEGGDPDPDPDPDPQPQPGPQDLCDGFRGSAPGELSPVADGCDELVGNLPTA